MDVLLNKYRYTQTSIFKYDKMQYILLTKIYIIDKSVSLLTLYNIKKHLFTPHNLTLFTKYLLIYSCIAYIHSLLCNNFSYLYTDYTSSSP